MDRRGFFKLFGAGVAGIALEQAIPLGRVWSFPSRIVVALPVIAESGLLTTAWIDKEVLRLLKDRLEVRRYFNDYEFRKAVEARAIRLRIPTPAFLRPSRP